MSRFEYDLVDERGGVVRESLDAPDFPAALREIQRRGFCTSLVEFTDGGERVVHFRGTPSGPRWAGCLLLVAVVVLPLGLFVGLELAGQGIGAALGLPVWGQVVAGFVLLHLGFKLFIRWGDRRLERLKRSRERNDDPEVENRW